MEMDDDFELPANSDVAATASPVRKLKRLKKGSRVSKDPLLDQPQSESGVELEALSVEESQPSDLGSRLGSESLGGEGDLLFSGGGTRSGLELNSVLDDLSGGGELSSGFDDLSPGFDGVAVSDEGEVKSGGDGLGDDGSGAKRALDFESVDEEFGETNEDRNEEVLEQGNKLGMEELEKKRRSSDALEEEEGNKKKSKKAKSGGGDETKSKVNKRRAEKERQEHLSQLHAETQRLLRETREAEFKPVPIVKKPISSVLEKIRQRKLEVFKKSMAHKACVGDDNGSDREMELESEGVVADGTGGSKISNVVIEEPIAFQTEKGSNANAACMDESNHNVEHLSSKSVSSQMDVDEASNQAFRAPIDDTQDLFSDSQNTDSRDNTDTPSSPLEEDFPPSILAMNLKLNLDSAPPDDVSSDEEYNDKENVKPHSPGLVGSSSPVRVQAFLDDEAEEEDDGDHDHLLFQDSEEDEAEEDADELRDMIATGYKEKSIDGERRNELHQKWLEQQDASFSEKLMQKLKFGSKLRETMSPEDNDAEEEGYQEFDNDDAEDVLGKSSDSGLPKKVSVRANLRIAKQMMSQMFTDNDVYLSSDDEIVKRPTRSCLFEKTEEQATFLSPAEDESCSEVFGRIKKLNIVPDSKKSKTSAITNMQHMGGNGIIPKVSFIRGSNHSQLSTRKRGLSTARCSFIFGRDDSNSMSATSMSEDSSDTFQRENAPARTTTKFSSSQIKSRKEKFPPATVEKADTSFFEILRHNSLHSKRKGTIIDQMIQDEPIEETIHTESVDHITRTVSQTMQKEFTAQRKKTQEVDKTIQSALASFRVGRTQTRQRQNLVHM